MTQRCDMTRAGARCTNLIAPDRITNNPLCDPCTYRLLDLLMRAPRWKEHALSRVTGQEVAEARALAEQAADRAAAHRALLAAERRAAEREAVAVHVVYYVRTGERTIKIGTTGHLAERMRAFRVANPDNLLAAEPGDRHLEQRRHRQFKAWRYHRRREDFADPPELLEHIAGVRAEHGDPWTIGGARR